MDMDMMHEVCVWRRRLEVVAWRASNCEAEQRKMDKRRKRYDGSLSDKMSNLDGDAGW